MKDPYLIEFPTFSASLDEDGKWIYKSKPIEPKKKSGALKKKYHDLPRVKGIYEIENAIKKVYLKDVLGTSMKEINAKLIEFSRAKR